MNCSFCKSKNPSWIEKTNEGNIFCNFSCQNRYYKIGINTTKLPKDIVILQLSYLKFKDLLKVYNTGNEELRNIIENDLNFRYRWIEKFSSPLNRRDLKDAKKVIIYIWKGEDRKKLLFIFGITWENTLVLDDLKFVAYAYSLPVFYFEQYYLPEYAAEASTDVLKFLLDKYYLSAIEKRVILIQGTIKYCNKNNFDLISDFLFSNSPNLLENTVNSYFEVLCEDNFLDPIRFILYSLPVTIYDTFIFAGLDRAVRQGFIPTIELIISKFQDEKETVNYVFIEAIRFEKSEVVKFLLENKMIIELNDRYFILSIDYRSFEVLKILLNYVNNDKYLIRRLLNNYNSEHQVFETSEEIIEYLTNLVGKD